MAVDDTTEDIDCSESQLLLLNEPPPPPQRKNLYALVVSLMASMTSILLGYDSGVMSGAAIYIKEDLRISDVQIELLVGAISLYSLIGAALAGRTSDWIGRRRTIILASAIFFTGAILMGFAPNYGLLMAGRFVTGIGMGYGLMIAPVYAAEVSPAPSRGFLTSFPEVFGNVGLLLGYTSNYAFSGLPTNLSWRVMLGVGALPAILLALLVLIIMPESPRWLVLQGRLDDARQVLYKTSNSLQESLLRLNEIKEAAGLIPQDCDDLILHADDKQSHSKLGDGVWRELLLSHSPAIQHIVLAVVGIHFFQQASGTDAVVIYSPRILEKAGVKSDSEKLLATIVVGISKTLFTLVGMCLVDRVGRRALLLISCGGVTASLMGLGVGLSVIDNGRVGDGASWGVILCVAMSLTCMAFFSTGMGPVAWVYTSEVFPLRLRAQGCSLGVVVNRMMSAVVLMTFISLYKAISIGGAFFLYGGIGVVSWMFFYTMLPETKERTLEEMEGLFGGFFRWRENQSRV